MLSRDPSWWVFELSFTFPANALAISEPRDDKFAVDHRRRRRRRRPGPKGLSREPLPESGMYPVLNAGDEASSV